MNTNSNYSLSFSGAFRIKPNELKAKTEIPKLFTEHRQIFKDIKEPGDMFVVLENNGADRSFLHYMKDNKLAGVEYFPEINTRIGLKDEKPEVLKAMLSTGKYKFFSKIEQISALIKNNAGNGVYSEPKEELSKVINAMRLNIENPKIEYSEKMTTVRDEAKKRTLYVISPNGSVNYALLRYDNLSNDSKRCTIGKEGNIIKEYDELKDLLAFDKEFSKLIKSRINTLR